VGPRVRLDALEEKKAFLTVQFICILLFLCSTSCWPLGPKHNEKKLCFDRIIAILIPISNFIETRSAVLDYFMHAGRRIEGASFNPTVIPHGFE